MAIVSPRARARNGARCLRSALLAPLLAALLCAGPAPGASAEESVTLDAVGRLNFAGYRHRRHCTMAAVGPRTVVTAAHCLAGLALDDVHLLFGYETMDYALHTGPVSVRDLGDDLAVVCLANDRAPATLPLARGRVAAGDTLTVTGYGAPRVHKQHDTTCRAHAVGARAIELDCAVAPGGSGGPVRGRDGAVVAVMSRSSQTRSLAVRVPPAVLDTCGDRPAADGAPDRPAG